jgi:hypothetical protein
MRSIHVSVLGQVNLVVILEILIIISLNRVHPEFISLRHVHFERTNAERV